MIRKNLRFIGFGFLLTFACNFGQTFFIGLYNQPIREAYGLSNGDFGSLYGFATLCSAALLVWLGRLIDHVDLRVYTVAVILLMVIACGLVFSGTGIAALAVALCLLRLSGQGLMTHISNTSMGRYFDTSRGKAISLAHLGLNVGQMILPPAALLLMAWLGWRESWGFYGLFLLFLLLPLVLFSLKGHAKRHEAWQAEVAITEMHSGQQSRMKSPLRDGLFRDSRFYCILPGYLGIPLFSTSVFFFQDSLLLGKGWPGELFAFSFPFFAIAMTIATPLGGYLVDRVGNSLKLMPLAYFPFATALLGLAYGEHSLWLPAMLMIMGVSSGFLSVLAGTLWAELYGTRMLGSIRSFVTSLMVLGTAATPAFMGYLYDGGLSIATSYVFFAVYMVATTGLHLKCNKQVPS